MHDHDHLEHILHGIDALTLGGFFAILSFSFVMSLHCAGMCGPLVCAKLGTRANMFGSALWLYNMGRLISYTGAGFLLGWIGESLSQIRRELGVFVALSLGGFLLIQGLGMLLGRTWFSWSIPIPRGINSTLKRISRLPDAAQDILLGCITVALPCMTLAAAFMAAAASSSPIAGAMVLFAFFLGTLPVMIAVPAMSANFANANFVRSMTRLGGLFLMISGAITLLRIAH